MTVLRRWLHMSYLRQVTLGGVIANAGPQKTGLLIIAIIRPSKSTPQYKQVALVFKMTVVLYKNVIQRWATLV